MSKPSSSSIVSQRITELEDQLLQDNEAVKESIEGLVTHLTPKRIFQSLIKNTIGSRELRPKLIVTAVAIAGGILARKFLVHKTTGVLGKIAGSALQLLLPKMFSRKISNNE